MNDLLRPGDKLHDPTTGTEVTLLELSPTGFVIEQVVPPHEQRSILNHFHQTWTEQFDILSGTGRYKIDGKSYDAPPQHTFIVNPGQSHVHPWNAGAEPLHFRQTDTFLPSDPDAAVNTFLGFSTMFGLAGEGKSRADGTPKNLLQLLVILEFFRQHGGYIVGLPAPVQDALMAGGAALGRALGYRPWYERYLPRQTE